jgi:hypothetical protein
MTRRGASRAGIAATLAAGLAIVAGLITLGKPSRARDRRLDELRVQDLTSLSSAIDDYWNKHSALPPTLDSLAPQISRVPVDPKSDSAYTYLPGGARSYRLCAAFAQPSDSTQPTDFVVGLSKHSWRHGAGESCFDLTVPERESK